MLSMVTSVLKAVAAHELKSFAPKQNTVAS